MTYSNCPYIVSPKDRKMTRAEYKRLSHFYRSVWRKNKAGFEKMWRDMIVFGQGSMEIRA
jgi:hypothetical protein